MKRLVRKEERQEIFLGFMIGSRAVYSNTFSSVHFYVEGANGKRWNLLYQNRNSSDVVVATNTPGIFSFSFESLEVSVEI